MRRGIFQKYAELFGLIFRLADLAVIVLVGIAAYWFRFNQWSVSPLYQFTLAMTVLLALLVFPAFRLYQPWRGASLGGEAWRASIAWGSVAGICLVMAYATQTGAQFSRIWFVSWVVGVLVALIVVRIALRLVLRRLRERGHNIRRVMILGAGDLGQRVARMLKNERWAGLEVVAFLDDDARLHGTEIDGVPVLGPVDQAVAYADYTRERLSGDRQSDQVPGIHADQVWITLPMSAQSRIRTVLAGLNQTSATVHFVPDIFSYQLLNHSLDEVAGVPIFTLSASPFTGRDKLLKTVEDKLLASVFLLLAAPVMLLIAVLVKLEGGGKVLFKQTRHGLDGQEIEVWKFRTMTVCENGPEFTQATRDDPRVTRLGAFLRQTSLDELPQLFNVLQGSMSLVGPRPHPVALNQEYRDQIGRYMARHTIKPGITGWAQINGWRGETDTIDKMEKRIEYDLWYIQNWSIWLDLKLIVKSMFVGFIGSRVY